MAYLHHSDSKFLDENGEEIHEFQQYGICGLGLFHERYPDAPVYTTKSKKISSKEISFLLEYYKCSIPEKRNECA
jgi:hypothetical protein